jgi:hypothetical protein
LDEVTNFKIGSWSVSHHHPIHLVFGSKQTTNTYQRTGLKWNTTKIDEYQFKIGNINPSDCTTFTDNIINVAEQLNMMIIQKTGKPWFDSHCHPKRRIVLQKPQDSRIAARSKESCLAYYNERKEYKRKEESSLRFSKRDDQQLTQRKPVLESNQIAQSKKVCSQSNPRVVLESF